MMSLTFYPVDSKLLQDSSQQEFIGTWAGPMATKGVTGHWDEGLV